MQYTAHYNLKKPDGNDTYDESNDNANMDAIDTQMKANADAAAAAQTSANSAQTAANAAIPTTEIGAANGVAGLDVNRNVPLANLGNVPPVNPATTTTAGIVKTTGTSGVAVTTDDQVYEHTARTDQSNTFTSAQTAPAFAASGLNGLPTPLRIVGSASTGGAPTSGTYQKGDVMIDFSLREIWLCTVSGTPGTWQSVNSAFATNASELNGQPASYYAAASSIPTNAMSAVSGGTKVQSGQVYYSTAAQSGTVTFPVAFTSAPVVIAISDERLSDVYLPSTPTTTGFTWNSGYSINNLWWIAIGQ
jgi:hypothetical protein